MDVEEEEDEDGSHMEMEKEKQDTGCSTRDGIPCDEDDSFLYASEAADDNKENADML